MKPIYQALAILSRLEESLEQDHTRESKKLNRELDERYAIPRRFLRNAKLHLEKCSLNHQAVESDLYWKLHDLQSHDTDPVTTKDMSKSLRRLARKKAQHGIA